MRASNELRHHRRIRNSKVRTARDQHRNNARSRRNPTLDKNHRKIPRHGNDPHRPTHYGQGSREARKLAMQIAQKAPVATRLAKEAVLKAFDTPLEEGLQFERRNFYLLFSTQDMKEGMKAFTEKRPPQFKGR